MKLAFFQRLDQAGGGSRASLRVTLQTLRDQRPDWNLTLVTQSNGPLSQQAAKWQITLRQSAFPRFRKLWERLAFWRVCRHLADELGGLGFEGVLSNEWVTAPHAFEVARRLQVPAMSYVRDFAALQRGKKYQLHRMNRLLCVCESMRQGLIQVGYDPERVRTVYDPVLRPLLREPDSQVLGQISQAMAADRWLLYLGRISPRKNQLEAVQVLQHLREITGQRWGLLLAGDADENYAAAVDQAVSAAGLVGAVLQLGLIQEPGWLFELVEASIMTSKSEGLARVLIESLLCGKPSFAFPVDGLEDIFGEDLPCFVTEQRDPLELAQKIAVAMADSNHFRDRTETLGAMLEARHSKLSHVAAFEQAVSFRTFPNVSPSLLP